MKNKEESINLARDWKLVNFCEFDQYAEKSYCAIHNVNKNLNLGDITKIDETKLEPFNMICGGSPCTDFSVAGKMSGSVWTCKDCEHKYNPLTVHWSKRGECPECGSENLDKTRSSLLVEWLRIIRANKPNFGIYENVKNIVGKQFKETTFKLFEEELQEYGYITYWKVLNAKNYGIPQNRERVYLILIKKELDNGIFKFPEPFDNGIRLKDILENEVDEKYYISEDKVEKFLSNMKINEEHIDNMPVRLGNVYGEQFGTGYAGNVWDKDSISSTIMTMQGGGRQPHIVSGIDKSYNNTKFIENANCLTAREDRGISNRKSEGTAAIECIGNMNPSGNGMNGNVFSENGLSPTITTNKGEGNKILQRPRGYNKGGLHDVCPTLSSHSWECNNFVKEHIRIRKLIPLECFRLMGFSDENFYATEKAVSNSQLYKQAGNSIVVDVLYYILVELYKAMPYLFDDLRLSSYFSGIGAFEIALDRLFESINTGNFTRPQAE